MSRYRYLIQREIGGRRRAPTNPLFARARQAAVYARNRRRIRMFNHFASLYGPENVFWINNGRVLVRRTSFGTNRFLGNVNDGIFE